MRITRWAALVAAPVLALAACDGRTTDQHPPAEIEQPPAAPTGGPVPADWVVYTHNRGVGGYAHSVWCTRPGNEDIAQMRLVPVSKSTYNRVAAAPETSQVPCPDNPTNTVEVKP